MKEIKTADNMQNVLDNQALQPYHSLPKDAILLQMGALLVSEGLITQQEKIEYEKLFKEVC